MNYYIRLVQGKGLISRLIEFKESDWPSHVELVETDDRDIPLRVLGSRYPDGVKYRGYNDYPVQKDVWYKPVQPVSLKTTWSAMETLIGFKYDLIDIFGIALNRDWQEDSRYICSEAVAWAAQKSGFALFNTEEETHKIMPSHYLLTPAIYRYRTALWDRADKTLGRRV